MFPLEPIVDKSRRYIPVAKPSLTKREELAAANVIGSGWISSGPKVEEFEHEFAAAHNRKYGVACNSGGTALVLALRCLNVCSYSTVVCPTLSMVATANAIIQLGARPFFVESFPSDGNAPVHSYAAGMGRQGIVAPLYGNPIQADEGDYRPGYLVEDCAECHYAKGIGRVADLMTFSFYANKIITTGEGGMVLTSDANRADRLRSLRAHAFTKDCHFVHSEMAYSARMTDVQAAIGLIQHKRHREILGQRAEVAQRYTTWLESVPWIRLPERTPGSVWWVFPIVAETAGHAVDARARLAAQGIETRSYFVPLHRQEHLKRFAERDYPIADDLSQRGFYLPLYPDLRNDDIDLISKILRDI